MKKTLKIIEKFFMYLMLLGFLASFKEPSKIIYSITAVCGFCFLVIGFYNWRKERNETKQRD